MLDLILKYTAPLWWNPLVWFMVAILGYALIEDWVKRKGREYEKLLFICSMVLVGVLALSLLYIVGLLFCSMVEDFGW